MKELFFLLSGLFLLVLWYVAYCDWKSKLIYLWSFYLLNIVTVAWLFFLDAGIFKYVMLLYLLAILTLDILEYIWKLPKFINEGWMIGETWIYDYWFYLFLITLFVDFLKLDFMGFYIWFTLSLLLWWLIGFLITKQKYKKHIPLFVYAFFIILWMLLTIYLRLY